MTSARIENIGQEDIYSEECGSQFPYDKCTYRKHWSGRYLLGAMRVTVSIWPSALIENIGQEDIYFEQCGPQFPNDECT